MFHTEEQKRDTRNALSLSLSQKKKKKKKKKKKQKKTHETLTPIGFLNNEF